MKIGLTPPVDYYKLALKEGQISIDDFYKVQQEDIYWQQQDADLHIYPYTHALPLMLSMGCENKCPFCPTAEYHKGKIIYGNPEKIIPNYKGKVIHFVDENFFDNPQIELILTLLKQYEIKWLAMTTYSRCLELFNKLGAKYLFDCGCRVLEVGLENVVLYKKVKDNALENEYIEICYLNMTLLPNETVETIKKNAEFMADKSLTRPIHHNNGLWYSPGQYYYPYGKEEKGRYTTGQVARTKPTFVPESFLNCSFEIKDLEVVNHYSKLVNGFKVFPEYSCYKVEDFIFNNQENKITFNGIKDWQLVMWLCVGIRTGGIV